MSNSTRMKTKEKEKSILPDVSADSKLIYKLGAIAAIIVVLGTLLDISLVSIPGWGSDSVPETSLGFLEQINDNKLLGLRNLDLLNVIISLFLTVSFFAIYTAHQKTHKALAGLALIIYLIGTIVFITNNAALSMLDLADKFADVSSGAEKESLVAAGEAILAKGAHGSPGIFFGFMLPVLANIAMSFVMLKAKVFTKTTAYIGLTSFSILLLYTVVDTFLPGMEKIAMIIVMPAGILSLVWNILVVKKLFGLSR